MTRASVRAACVALLMAAPLAARADLWAWIDERGTAHFAAEKLDERYELFSRGGTLDTVGDSPAPAATGRGTALPGQPALSTFAALPEPSAATPRLVAYVENSPTYRQVQLHLREASQAQRLDYELVKAVITAESGFDAQAVSPKGAIGLMQVIPATAERFGVNGSARAPIERQLADPRTNIRTGTRYLRHLMDLFNGQLDLALAAYNAGEGAVQRAGNRIPQIRETQNYVKTVLQIYAALKPPVPPAPAPAAAAPARRVRVEMPGAVPGRSNMPSFLKNNLD